MANLKKDLNIIQWNINGSKTRFEHLKILQNELKPYILCIQETNFKQDTVSELKGYSNYQKNRTNTENASGGVAIFTKNSILADEITLDTDLEAIAIKIKMPSKVSIGNIYLPYSQPSNLPELKNIVNQLPKPFILLGD